jgi:hypothetical protein
MMHRRKQHFGVIAIASSALPRPAICMMHRRKQHFGVIAIASSALPRPAISRIMEIFSFSFLL